MDLTLESYEAYADAWNTLDAEGVLSCHTEDCVYEDVAYGMRVEGIGKRAKLVQGVFASIPDFHLEVCSLRGTDSFAVAEWVMSGTRRDGAFDERGTTAIDLRNGRFCRNSDYHNLLPEK